MTNLDCILKSRDIICQHSQSYGFFSSHVWMWKSDHKEGWALKNWCFWTVVLEKTLESPLDCEEIKPIHSKGNQSWIFIGGTDAEAEAKVASTLATWCVGLTHWKRPWCWKRLKAEEKGMTEDEMVGSPTQWTWVWPSSGRWWRTGKPGVLQSIGSQRVGHWVTEQQGHLPSA